jgi:2-(1,2-epoxy-1,2-dihydrophenyl)acetyl-CoA isomerase
MVVGFARAPVLEIELSGAFPAFALRPRGARARWARRLLIERSVKEYTAGLPDRGRQEVMATPFENIRLEIESGVAWLTLHRPDRLNSFTVAMHEEIQSALTQLRADRAVRCLVLTGAGRGFCAGQDLSDRAVAPGQSANDLGMSIEKFYIPLVTALRTLPLPVIAAVNGVAAGAGANIALACDLVIAARSASFIQSFAKIGLVPDSGGTWLLPKLVGNARALGLALLGEKLGAEQAQAWGLIWSCVDDAELMPSVKKLATQLAAGPTRGLARTKQAIYAASTQTFDQSLALERDFQRELGQSPDYAEGVAAFLEKRAAKFSGA